MGKFSIRKRLRSFRFAFRGISFFFKNEHNVWIHLLATIVVVAVGICFDISHNDWIAITLAIGLVFVAEALNTAVEQLADSITQEPNKYIEKAKDVAAGAVLIAAIVAIVIAIIVFVPITF